MMDKTELREKLAELDHKHWEYFTKSATNAALVQRMLPLHDFLKAEWGMYWKPYADLPEGLKNLYRKWADQFLELLSKWPGLEVLDVSSEDKAEEKDPIKVRHIILMLLDAHRGVLAGNDSIHAEVYLLHSIFFNLFCKLNLVFRHHYYYGYPYSPKIVHAVDELVGAGFVNKRFYCCGTPGLVLLDSGYSLVRELRVEYTEEYDAIKQFVERLGCVDFVYGLRAAAKVHFLVEGEGDVLTRERAIREMRQFSPHISVTSINVAVEILNRLGLLEQ